MRKLLPAWGALAFLTASVPAAGRDEAALTQASAAPTVEKTFSSIFYQTGNPPYQELPIALKLSPKEAARIVPRRDGRFGMIVMVCTRMQGRRLTDCRIDVEPKDMGYEAAAQALRAKLRVDEKFAMPDGAVVRFVDVQFRVWNSATPDLMGPCWPPGCIREPGPPPPPPPKP